jgi:ribosomal-protein-serine acetyltransferase
MRSVEDERRWVEGCMKAQAEGTHTPPLIVYQGALVGCIVAERIDLLRKSCEIGYWLAQDLQGRGIVTRACRGLLTFVFDSLGMNHVQIRVVPENTRSLAIPKRLGFVYEGTQRQAQFLNGQFHDFAVYSMLASEWANRTASRGSLAQANS